MFTALAIDLNVPAELSRKLSKLADRLEGGIDAMVNAARWQGFGLGLLVGGLAAAVILLLLLNLVRRL